LNEQAKDCLYIVYIYMYMYIYIYIYIYNITATDKQSFACSFNKYYRRYYRI